MAPVLRLTVSLISLYMVILDIAFEITIIMQQYICAHVYMYIFIKFLDMHLPDSGEVHCVSLVDVAVSVVSYCCGVVGRLMSDRHAQKLF